MLPQVVHQIWFNFQEFGHVVRPPAKYNVLSDSWRTENPDWTMLLWNEQMAEQLMETHGYDKWLAKFRQFPQPIQRADFFRWVVLFHMGGVYADIDCMCQRPMGDLRKRYGVIGDQDPLLVVPNSKWVMNAMIVASPRHPTVKRLIDSMSPSKKSWHGSSRSVESVFASTGPKFVGRFLRSEKGSGTIIFDDDMLWHHPGGKMPPDRPFFALHEGHGAWNYTTYAALDHIRIVVAIVVSVAIVAIVALAAYLVLIKQP